VIVKASFGTDIISGEIMEDFPPLGIPNVHSLIPDSKPHLVVKVIG
jgi:hypothetical protein